MSKVSIIIPAHNEEKTIKSSVSKLTKYFSNAEVIVVCNGCSDMTYERCSELKSENLKIMDFKDRIGKGGAVLKGMAVAKGDIVGFVDADGSFSPNDVEKIIDNLNNCDCSIASKWKGKKLSEVNSDFKRKIGSRGWNLMSRMFLGLDVRDTQAGLKFFKRDVMRKILETTFICKGFDFDVELLYKIKKNGFTIEETHTPIRRGKKSTFKMSNSPKMFVNFLRFYFSKDKN